MFKVQNKSCSTCIFNKNSPLNLAKLVKEALENDGFRICHHSKDVCCRGFWNKFKNDFNLGRISQRLNSVEFVNIDIYKEVNPNENIG